MTASYMTMVMNDVTTTNGSRNGINILDMMTKTPIDNAIETRNSDNEQYGQWDERQREKRQRILSLIRWRL